MIKNILNNKDKKTTGSTNPSQRGLSGPAGCFAPVDEINSNYYKLFNHYNQKYKLEELRAL